MNPPAPSGPLVLCLGEALVDLIGERHAPSLAEVDRFAPHVGGTVATVAVVAARAGARTALAGAAGDDRWGRWLQERLRAEQVDDTHFVLTPELQTQLAFVAVDPEGEPTSALYAEPAETVVTAVADRIPGAVRAAGGLFLSATTLAGARERAVSMRARALALELGRPVIVDCGLRLDRWATRADAAASANACVPGALLVRAGQAEAELMTGESDPERAATALRKAGATMAVISLRGGATMLRGPLRADVPAAPAAPARVVSTVGAGGVLAGILLARLALSGWYPPAAAAGLGEAVAAEAAACERWGAVD